MKEDDMVDLEQFREAVEAFLENASVGMSQCANPANEIERERHEAAAADFDEAQRLLSIIDNAGKVECAEPVAWITPESIRHLAKMNGPANVVVWNCASGNARVPLYAAPHQPAPVVDDAMVERALNAKVRNWPVRQLFDSECEARIAMRAALTAALTSAQGVERE